MLADHAAMAAEPIAVTLTARLRGRIYSFRRATTGSTRDARRAGTKQAMAATSRK
jgi:hypothetical protein